MTHRPSRPSFRTLWLPLEDPLRAWSTFGLVFLVYLLTMSRGLGYYDSGELALVARELGLGHPLGQPTHTMLGWLFSRLPFVPPLAGLNLLSALAGALATVPALSMVESLRPDDGDGDGDDAWVRWVPAVVVFCFALHLPLWDPASRIEVYALAMFPALWGTAKIMAAASRPNLETHGRDWLAAGVAFGLSACANALMALLVALSLAPSLLARLFRRRMERRALAFIVAGGLLGLSPFAYVLIIAQWPGDALVWGAPVDRESILFYFSGADYAVNQSVPAAVFVDNLVRWTAWGVDTSVLPLMVVGLAGCAALSSRSGFGTPVAPLLGVLSVLDVCRKGKFHPEVLDGIDYLGPAFFLAAVGAAALLQQAVLPTRRVRRIALAAVALLLATPLFTDPALHQRTRASDRTPRMLAEGALHEAPEGAVMLVDADHWAAPLLYLQQAEGVRPDVVIFPHGLGSSSWYWEHVFARHPELARIELRGPGGRNGRFRRLLDANPERPVVVESWDLAMRVGESVCDAGWLLHCGGCSDVTPADDTDERLREALDAVGSGSPPAHEVIASVAFDRGEALWRLGRSEEALDALRAGIPRDLMPDGGGPTAVTGGQPLGGPLPEWRRHTPIADPARNLFMAANLLASAGELSAARSFLTAAARDGLPEAKAALR